MLTRVFLGFFFFLAKSLYNCHPFVSRVSGRRVESFSSPESHPVARKEHFKLLKVSVCVLHDQVDLRILICVSAFLTCQYDHESSGKRGRDKKVHRASLLSLNELFTASRTRLQGWFFLNPFSKFDKNVFGDQKVSRLSFF